MIQCKYSSKNTKCVYFWKCLRIYIFLNELKNINPATKIRTSLPLHGCRTSQGDLSWDLWTACLLSWWTLTEFWRGRADIPWQKHEVKKLAVSFCAVCQPFAYSLLALTAPCLWVEGRGKNTQGTFGEQVGEGFADCLRSQEKMGELQSNLNMRLNMLTKGRYF